MSMYDTQTIEIAADPAQVQAFVEDGANLPRWAIGFAKDARLDGDDWIVTTGAGDRIPTVIVSNATRGYRRLRDVSCPQRHRHRVVAGRCREWRHAVHVHAGAARRDARRGVCRPGPRHCRMSSLRSRRSSKSSVRCERR